jgi:hypothetical protein
VQARGVRNPGHNPNPEEVMPNDRKQTTSKGSTANKTDSSKDKRVIGKGMTSLDSTQAPLNADGEPDTRAMTGKGKQSKDSK